MPLPLFACLVIGTGIGLGLTSILIMWVTFSQPFIAFQNAYQDRPSSWWMKNQQLKKGEKEIKQLRKAISNTRVETGADRDRWERVHTCTVGCSPEQSGPSETATRRRRVVHLPLFKPLSRQECQLLLQSKDLSTTRQNDLSIRAELACVVGLGLM